MHSKSYTNQIDLIWQKNVAFVAKNKNNQTVVIDGSQDLGGQDLGVRPMETVLMGLAGCAAIDVLVILRKADFLIEGFNVRVLANRDDRVPQVFTEIHLVFSMVGNMPNRRFQHAIKLSMEKYCSVTAMLNKTAKISWEGNLDSIA